MIQQIRKKFVDTWDGTCLITGPNSSQNNPLVTIIILTPNKIYLSGMQYSRNRSRSVFVREFDNLCSDVSLVAMDLASKMARIFMK